jgi:hypothetical protein
MSEKQDLQSTRRAVEQSVAELRSSLQGVSGGRAGGRAWVKPLLAAAAGMALALFLRRRIANTR